MGWFSRSQPAAQSGRRSAPRSNHATEAQVAELRGKARRRLIGALVLVLTAVIVVPMLFDSPPSQRTMPAPVVVPAMPLPQSHDTQVAVASGAAQSPTPAPETLTDVPVTLPPAHSASPSPEPSGSQPAASASNQAKPSAETPQASSQPKAEPQKSEPAKAPSTSQSGSARTDDGSVAIALLQGKLPARVAAPEKGNFILQIAAYGTEKDAQMRREKLVAAGVTNAYVEQASSGGKSTYRLRVGPFPTRDAAQAAQARLRALGYDNGFISTQ
jgi:DedD protein